jgi:DNA-binding XRE family transcriptional regulator
MQLYFFRKRITRKKIAKEIGINRVTIIIKGEEGLQKIRLNIKQRLKG